MRQILPLILCTAWAACSPTSAQRDHSPPQAVASTAKELPETPALGGTAAASRDVVSPADLLTRAEQARPSRASHPAAAGHPAASERAPAPGNAATSDQPAASGSSLPSTFEHALLISVDGLRSDALRAVPASELPNFRRLMNGAGTLNARTDPDYTVTLPNHTDMFTGRPVLGPAGHGWVKNDDAEPGETLHKNHGGYVASMFDVAHDRGFHTALFAGKNKFAVYDASYDAENGAPDATESAPPRSSTAGQPIPSPVDASSAGRGRRKIDTWKFTPKTDAIAELVIANLGAAGQRSLLFAHFAITDLTGHDSGWDVTPRSRYMRAVATVDKELGRILDAIESSASLHGKTVVVLTADHGGGAPFKSHDQTQMWIDYIIPFLVWTGDGSKSEDLYALNSVTRHDPGLSSPRLSDLGPPPIRNGDSGNLVLSLLGLPPVPGSTFNARQDLKIR